MAVVPPLEPVAPAEVLAHREQRRQAEPQTAVAQALCAGTEPEGQAVVAVVTHPLEALEQMAAAEERAQMRLLALARQIEAVVLEGLVPVAYITPTERLAGLA